MKLEQRTFSRFFPSLKSDFWILIKEIKFDSLQPIKFHFECKDLKHVENGKKLCFATKNSFQKLNHQIQYKFMLAFVRLMFLTL